MKNKRNPIKQKTLIVFLMFFILFLGLFFSFKALAKVIEFDSPVKFKGETVEPTTDVAEGMTYYNSTEKKLYYYDGTSWKPIISASGETEDAEKDDIFDGLVQSTASGDSYFTGGNVGIGTNIPQTPLDVRGGDINIPGFGGGSDDYAATVGYVKSAVEGGETGVGLWSAGTGDDIYKKTTAGNVGIGTTSATQKFVVGNDIGGSSFSNPAGRMAVGSSGLSGYDLGEDTNNRAGMLWNPTSNFWYVFTKSNGTIYDQTLVIKDGNVGIGTTVPGANLDVNGNIEADNLTLGERMTSATAHVLGGATINNATYQSGYGVYIGGPEDNYFAGSVGIGTADPGSYKLNVNGNLYTTTINTGSGDKYLGDTAIVNGDTNSIPTNDQVYDFVYGNYAKYSGRVVTDLNNYLSGVTSGFYGVNGTAANSPEGSYQALIVARNSDVGFQLLGGHGTDDLWYRGWSSSTSPYDWRRIWHDNNDGPDSGLNADLLDGTSSGGFLRSDATDYLTSTIYFRGDLVGGDDGYRDHGVFGNYDSYKTDHIWSMGTAYRNAADGSNFGGLYGMAYCHTNNANCKSGLGHQIEFVNNGTVGTAIGLAGGIWTSGSLTVGNNGSFSGTVTADAFVGDGSGLTNIDAGDVEDVWVNNSGDTMTGALTFSPVGPSGYIGDTFVGDTYKSYINFNAGSGSSDPGYIMHETSGTETNEGVLHLVPSDDNVYGDYVSIHGTNDPDMIKLHTSGDIEGVNNLTASGDLSVAGGDISITNNNGGINFNDSSAYWLKTATNWGLYWNTGANTLGFHGAGTERGYIDLDNGNIQIDGDLTVSGGDITAAVRIMSAGTETILTAGEMMSWMSGFGGEIVHIGGESGVKVYSSADNSGVDHTTTLIDTSGFMGVGMAVDSDYTLTVADSGITNGGAAKFNGDVDLGQNKLTAGEVDPAYEIDGVTYATYALSTVGLKEEVLGKVKLEEKVKGFYLSIIDFSKAEKPSDIWLFKKITAWGEDWSDLIVSLTPEGRAEVWYEFDLENNLLYIWGTRPVKVSYSLVAPRFDWPERDNNFYQGNDREGVGIKIE